MIFFRVSAALLLAGPVFAASPLDKKVTLQASAGLEIETICRVSGLPCAIELDSSVWSVPRARAPFRVQDETVAAALSRAILLYHGHRWRWRKGVIYVTPNAPISGSPLDRTLARKDFDMSLDDARAEFGVKAGFCSPPVGRASTSPGPKKKVKVSFALAGESTPRAALNALVLRLGRAAWLVESSPPSGGRSIFCLDLVDYDD